MLQERSTCRVTADLGAPADDVRFRCVPKKVADPERLPTVPLKCLRRRRKLNTHVGVSVGSRTRFDVYGLVNHWHHSTLDQGHRLENHGRAGVSIATEQTWGQKKKGCLNRGRQKAATCGDDNNNDSVATAATTSGTASSWRIGAPHSSHYGRRLSTRPRNYYDSATRPRTS